MSDTTYLLARLQDDRVIGFGVFSEDDPTISGRGRWVTVLTTNGKTYDEAHRRAVDLAISYGCDIGPATTEALQRLSAGSRGELVEDRPVQRIAELENEVATLRAIGEINDLTVDVRRLKRLLAESRDENATLRAILASVPVPDEDA